MKRLLTISLVLIMALVLVLSFSLITALPARAAPVTITAATNGDNISADTAGVAWTDLGLIRITETANDDFVVSATNVTLILSAPDGFQFNAGQVPSIDCSPVADIADIGLSISSSNITVTYRLSGAGGLDMIVIGDGTVIQVQPMAGTPLASGNILRDASSNSTIPGIDGATNFGTLTEVAGAITTLAVIQQPTDTLVGVAIAPAVTVRADDQFDNPVPTQNITVIKQAGTGALTATSPQLTDGTGIATFNDLSIDTVGPGKVLRFTAAAITVDSNPFTIAGAGGITVNPTSGLVTTEAGGTDNFTIVLDTIPTANVTIGLSSSDTTEGIIFSDNVIFTTGNWNTPQTITVAGIDDTEVDGDVAYTIITANASSTGLNYNNLNASDVGVTNMDNDVAPASTVGGFEYQYEYIDVLGKGNMLITSYTGEVYKSVETTSPDGMLTIYIPKGTDIKNEKGQGLHTLEINVNDNPPPPPEGANIIGLPYNFKPDGATFDPPITLTFTYDPEDVPEGISEEDLVLAFYDEENGVWVELDCVCDPDTHCIIACVSHFTSFAILGKEVILPASFSLSNLTVVPAEVEPGETVTVTVTVANTGGMAGDYALVLEVNGTKEATQELAFAAGSTTEAIFKLSKKEPGTYLIKVGSLSGSVTVAELLPPPSEPVPQPSPPPAEAKTPPLPPSSTTPAPPPSEPEPATNWLLIGVLAAAVVLFISLIVRWIIRRKYD